MLTGITVVDFSRHLPGPYCTMRLADLGAEVIKVEAHPGGDPGRSLGPRVKETGALFLSSNRNKRSVALNLHTEAGRALAFDLASRADVVVESFRPGVMRHLGLDYDSLSAVHPSLVYCSVTGYGQTGDMHQLGGHDLNYQAISGLLSAIRDSEGRPVPPEVPIADYAVGLYAAEQICAALVRQCRHGQGAYLDVAAVDVLSSWMGLHALLAHDGQARAMGQFLKGMLAYQVYESADGKYVTLAALEEKFWHNFCRAVGREDWETLHGALIADHPDVYEEMKALFLSRTQAEWSELGSEVDCCLTAVEEMDTWSGSAYVASREVAFTLPYGTDGETLQVRVERSRPLDGMTPPPRCGEDTRDVLKTKLNLTDDELTRLEQEGVIPQRML
ncbi:MULTISPECIES: CaiB/BaiF CoA-transferase family protein [Brevibacillus]|jgi:succinate---hydroxymethylglutarate CoA-transferase|uniref:CaiB/BaiF CoA transferase family protein n=1 Tax=Brevibacillus TaxID=55080 RepID=UPI000E3B35B3|nr:MULTISPECIES: CoA transferase [Brevibacillus]MDT3414767.1 crotonobetainyl-CoA:carnitine CoA-transferase CaiB-like acyl-CoA transferase [Brevibacillus aydinogluensis]NNV01462.1 CoA transferase [Brevibacillus sp. MCWH]REK61889.1 MAG: CoA transferase [Brevibacillus sp.]